MTLLNLPQKKKKSSVEELLVEKDEAEKKQKHCYWDNWIALTLTSAIFFTARSMLTGEISALGFPGVIYMGSGPIIFGVFYFTCMRDLTIKNNPADERKVSVRKVIHRTWDNRIDWWTLFIVLVGGVGIGAILVGVILAL